MILKYGEIIRETLQQLCVQKIIDLKSAQSNGTKYYINWSSGIISTLGM